MREDSTQSVAPVAQTEAPIDLEAYEKLERWRLILSSDFAKISSSLMGTNSSAEQLKFLKENDPQRFEQMADKAQEIADFLQELRSAK